MRSTFEAMGTTIEVLAPFDRPDAAPKVAALFAEWDLRFSRFRSDSELSRVNASAGCPIVVSPSFATVLEAALAAAAATGGLFDPTVLHRLEDLGYDRTFAELEGDRRPAPPRPWSAGAWRAIEMSTATRRVRLPAGTGLDFGGIAKGMAVDAAIESLVAAGIGRAGLSAGGDLAVVGQPDGASSWQIDVELPGPDGFPGEGVASLDLPSGALATSSIGRRRWRTRGTWHHHLIDPRTGEPADTGLWSMSVAARTCREAEVAAKATLLLGEAAGRSFLLGHGLSGLAILPDGTMREIGVAVS